MKRWRRYNLPIEFYLPYEDVQNALKESAQNPFIRTKDEGVVGNNECKLNKAQKRMLKDKEIYNHLVDCKFNPNFWTNLSA